MAVDSPQLSSIEIWLNRIGTPPRRVLLLRGTLSLLFGVLALPWPGGTLVFLLALCTAWLVVTGLGAAVAAIRNRHAMPGWGLTLVLGLACLSAGVIALAYPGPSLLALVMLVGINALATGVIDLVLALRWRGGVRRAAMQLLAGCASILFGLLVLLVPDAGALALVLMLALYAIAHGALLLAQALDRSAWDQPWGPAVRT